MTNGTRSRRYLMLGLLALGLQACSEEETTNANNNTEIAEQPEIEAKQHPVLPTIELAALPDAVNLDPCQLLSESELKEIGLPTDQHLRQQAASRQIPNHSPITPFVSCKWRAVDQGTPVGWVQIQKIEGEVTPQGEERYSLGESAWKGTYEGRDQLIIKTGDRLVMIVNQIPYNGKTEMESNLWIAEKVLGRLQQVADSTSPQPANASLVGGPSLDLCAASQAAKPYELLLGDKAWAFPGFMINYQPSMKERPQEDGVFCTYSSNRRGSISVSYLGDDGVKRWNSYYEKNGSKETLEQYEVFRTRKRIYIPLDKGAVMVEASGIRFSDEEIADKLNEVALHVLSQL